MEKDKVIKVDFGNKAEPQPSKTSFEDLLDLIDDIESQGGDPSIAQGLRKWLVHGMELGNKTNDPKLDLQFKILNAMDTKEEIRKESRELRMLIASAQKNGAESELVSKLENILNKRGDEIRALIARVDEMKQEYMQISNREMAMKVIEKRAKMLEGVRGSHQSLQKSIESMAPYGEPSEREWLSEINRLRTMAEKFYQDALTLWSDCKVLLEMIEKRKGNLYDGLKGADFEMRIREMAKQAETFYGESKRLKSESIVKPQEMAKKHSLNSIRPQIEEVLQKNGETMPVSHEIAEKKMKISLFDRTLQVLKWIPPIYLGWKIGEWTDKDRRTKH